MVLTGNARMQERPIKPLVTALTSQGARIEYLAADGCLPLRVFGGGLAGGVCSLSASLSSQYVSSILMAAPLTPSGMQLVLAEANPTSLPYILMTMTSMAQFGVSVQFDAAVPNRFSVPAGSRYTPAADSVFVEPDASSASYPAAIAAISGRTVTLPGITAHSSQGTLASTGCRS